MNRRLLARAAAPAVIAVLVLSGCGSDDSSPTAEPAAPASSPAVSSPPETTPSSVPSSSPTAPAGQVLQVSLDGDKVRPNARELKLKVGEKLTLEITSDRVGELHVHSTPDQYIDFKAGKTTTSVVIKAPGKVEVEEHDSGAVVALLEVR